MFGEKVFRAEGFESTWKVQKTSCNQTSQTTEFKTKNQQTSTSASTNIQTQTENNQSDTTIPTDMNKLAAWLKKICPDVINELNDRSYSNAVAYSQLNSDNLNVSVEMFQELNLSENCDKNVYVSAMSWNSSGNILAVSYNYFHENWCHHQGEIYLFTFNRNEILSSFSTNKLICASCVTVLTFHPQNPSILCAGTISGEIYLWDIQLEGVDNLIAMVTEHDDRITTIQWVTNDDAKKQSISLASASLDCYLFFWEVIIDENVFKVKNRFTTGKRNKSIISPEVFSKKSDGGIVNFDISPFVTGLFVLAMEGGSIIKCSTIGAKSMLCGDEEIFDPSISEFERHTGEIISISFSPHRKEIFLSCASDEEIRIFHIDQASPVQIIFMDSVLNSVSWVLHEEKLLIGAGQNGSVRIYSLLNGQLIPNDSLENSEPLTKFAINKKRANIVAFGSEKGRVLLYRVPWADIALQDYRNVYGKK